MPLGGGGVGGPLTLIHTDTHTHMQDRFDKLHSALAVARLKKSVDQVLYSPEF